MLSDPTYSLQVLHKAFGSHLAETPNSPIQSNKAWELKGKKLDTPQLILKVQSQFR